MTLDASRWTLRVPRGLAARVLALIAFLLAAHPLRLESETLTIDSFYPALMQRHLTLSTFDKTLLASEAGAAVPTDVRVGARFSGTPVSRLTVAGQTVIGANQAAPGSESVSLVGGDAGLTLGDRSTSNAFTLYATGSSFYIAYNTGNVLRMDPAPRVRLCEWVNYTMDTGGVAISPTYCDAGSHVFYSAATAGGDMQAVVPNSSTGSAGYILCCKMPCTPASGTCTGW